MPGALVLLVVSSPSARAQEPVVTFDPPTLRFGVVPYEELVVDEVAVVNSGTETLQVTVNPQLPDDFSALIDSTCAFGQPTTLAPGERCTQVIGFRPTEFFAPREVASVRATATDLAGTVLFDDEVRVIGWSVPRERILDLSEHGVGPLDPDFFAADAVRFLRGAEVAWVQGDEAVVGPVILAPAAEPRAATVTLAPTAQGTAWYGLSAHDAGGARLAAVGARITQDDGAADTDPPGYVTLSLVDLPPGTRTLRVVNRFVGSSYPEVSGIGFGVSEIRLYADPID